MVEVNNKFIKWFSSKTKNVRAYLASTEDIWIEYSYEIKFITSYLLSSCKPVYKMLAFVFTYLSVFKYPIILYSLFLIFLYSIFFWDPLFFILFTLSRLHLLEQIKVLVRVPLDPWKSFIFQLKGAIMLSLKLNKETGQSRVPFCRIIKWTNRYIWNIYNYFCG